MAIKDMALPGLAVHGMPSAGPAPLALRERVLLMVKDRNVFEPFLILPVLFLIGDMVMQRIQPWKIAATLIIWGLSAANSRLRASARRAFGVPQDCATP